jgi:16S rRNA (guanine527-N7)-methyltransferase
MHAPAPEVQSIVNKAVTRFHCHSSEALSGFLTEVVQWNETLSLVSRKDPLAAIERLLFESLELAYELGLEHGRIADIGSGAGFPGIVWAVSFPRVEVTMIERRERRSLFLERMCRTLPIENAASVTMDALDAVKRPEFQNAYDLAVTMAVGDPAAIAPAIEAMLTPEGRFASTVPAQSTASPLIGSALQLQRRVDGEFGSYVIYARSA